MKKDTKTVEVGSLTKRDTITGTIIIAFLFFMFGFTKIGASLMVMGLAGNAILPLVYGYFVDISNARQAYWVLFPFYSFLVFYAFHGYSIRRWKSAGV